LTGSPNYFRKKTSQNGRDVVATETEDSRPKASKQAEFIEGERPSEKELHPTFSTIRMQDRTGGCGKTRAVQNNR